MSENDNNELKKNHAGRNASPWLWVPSLYYAEGLPYIVAMSVSVIMYKKLGISNTDIALYTSWLYLPWVVKPLWSPLVDIFRTRRFWILATQIVMGAAFAMIALSIPGEAFFKWTLIFLWLMAFNSATHDIAADGFYILGLDTHQQAFFVGIRSTFYRLASISAQGLLVMLAGYFEKMEGFERDPRLSWGIVFFALAILFVVFAIYHFFVLPKPATDIPAEKSQGADRFADFADVFATFFKKNGILAAVAFLLLYRLGESQLVKIASPFLLDGVDKGGLGLSTIQIGLVYGTVGVAALTFGGIVGGIIAGRFGLKKCIWPMALAINIPDILYVYLAYFKPDNFLLVNAFVAIEQFGYGIGFAGYMLFMVYFAEDSKYKTAHYALMTGFMALGMMLPGMLSGKIQDAIGYPLFFVWVCLCTIPGFVSLIFLKISPEFGLKNRAGELAQHLPNKLAAEPQSESK